MANQDLLPFFLTLAPLRLVSEANMREHWSARNRRRVEQRHATYHWLRQWMPTPPALPLIITLTRVAPRMLDEDNAWASGKAVIDGIADWLDGAPFEGQDRQLGLEWRFTQRRGNPREYAVEIQIEALEPRNAGAPSYA